MYYVGYGFDILRHFAKYYDLFFNSRDYLFYLNYTVYLQHTGAGEAEDNIYLDNFVLVSSCVLVIVGNTSNARKTWCSQSLIQPKNDSGYRFWVREVWCPNSTFFSLFVLSKTVEKVNFN